MSNQKEFFKKSISLIVGVAIISLALSFWVKAWTEPTQSPPDGNASSSLNVGATGQTKTGWLATLDSLWVGLQGINGYPGVLQVLNGALINSNGAKNGLIVATGSVGFGTTSPTDGFRMEINGNVKLTGNTPSFKISNVASPIAGSDVATKSYVDAQSGGCSPARLRFAGYTPVSYNGNLGGPKGANDKCATAYAQYNNAQNHVHWCSLEELMEFGNSYPYNSAVWVRDAVLAIYAYGSQICPPEITYVTLYGGGGAGTATTTKDEDDSTCQAWRSSSASYLGPILNNAALNGKLGSSACNLTRPLACCYYGQ
jgi:hypothetical protein